MMFLGLLYKQGVTGSIPVTSTNILLSFCRSRLVGVPKFAHKLYVIEGYREFLPCFELPAT